jgi:hypothetical protein
MGDYALRAVPKGLAILEDDAPNTTIELVKYDICQGKEYCYVIGYFDYDTDEPCWELRFVGDRFKKILDGDCIAIFKMLRSAYDTLEEWVNEKEKNTDE